MTKKSKKAAPKRKPKKTKNKGGRPTKFKNDYIRQAYVACKEAPFTDVKLAKLFNVSKATIANWKNEHPEFLESIKKGKDEWDCLTAEKCLLKRVTGYRYTETTRELNPLSKDKDQAKMIITKKISKHVSPDVKACDIWLCNRHPERWRKLKHVELTGKDGDPLIVEVIKFSDINNAKNTDSK